jgi:hypothetical protein
VGTKRRGWEGYDIAYLNCAKQSDIHILQDFKKENTTILIKEINSSLFGL